MTVPHPRAVGSIGAEFVGWVQVELGISLRWWQVLFAVRLLEADAGRAGVDDCAAHPGPPVRQVARRVLPVRVALRAGRPLR
jgi:hypothetical protein